MNEHDAPDEFCRDLEAYLCRKNDGHLVRIVGPAFEQVRGWAARGVPLGVAQRGIDRYVERYYAKGPRRRPVRIEFCEADVLDAFDEWRKAIGLPLAAGVASVARERPGDGVADTLPAHLERAIARLTVARAGATAALDAAVDTMVRELDGMRAAAKGARGQSREALRERLDVLDRQLLDVVREHSDAAAMANVVREADIELAPFRDRMLADAYDRSRRACIDRLLRERARLPVLTFA